MKRSELGKDVKGALEKCIFAGFAASREMRNREHRVVESLRRLSTR